MRVALFSFLLVLLLLSSSAAWAAESAKIDPTTTERVQAFVSPVTGQIESLSLFDTQKIVDSIGNTYQAPLRETVVVRADAPALFAALDALLAKTVERDAALRAKRAAQASQAAAQAAAQVPK